MAEPKTPKLPKPAAELATYKVLSPLSVDGVRVDVGNLIDMSEKQATELIACGALEAA